MQKASVNTDEKSKLSHACLVCAAREDSSALIQCAYCDFYFCENHMTVSGPPTGIHTRNFMCHNCKNDEVYGDW